MKTRWIRIKLNHGATAFVGATIAICGLATGSPVPIGHTTSVLFGQPGVHPSYTIFLYLFTVATGITLFLFGLNRWYAETAKDELR